MEWRIYVENNEVDAPADMSAQFTFSVDDVRDFAARNTAFSKTIVLPGSEKNKRTFGHIFEIGSANFTNDGQPNVGYNFNAARAAKCLITQDGLPVFKGVIRIMEMVVDGESLEFEVCVFGELGGLVAALGDKQLSDLDFSEYNHTFNMVAITNSWTSAPGSGVYYGLIDYGYSQDKINFQIENFKPAFYVREYLTKLLKAAGYTWKSAFIDTDFFKRLIIPFKDGFIGKVTDTVLNAVDASNNWLYQTTGGNLPVPESFDSMSVNFLEAANGNTEFNYKRSDQISARLQYTASFTTTGTQILRLMVYINGNPVWQNDYSGASGSISIDTVIQLAPGDKLQIMGQAQNNNGAVTHVTGATLKLVGQPTVNVPIASGEAVVANNALPQGVAQKDFLASIIKMFNLYVDDDKETDRCLIIEPYINYYKGAPVVDWSQKLDRSKPYRLKPMSELSSRVYTYKYKDDTDFWNDYYKKKFGETYGTYNFDTGSEFAIDKQSVEVIFSPTPLVGYGNSERVLSAIYKRDSTSLADSPTTSNIRILSRSLGTRPCMAWNVTQINGTINQFAFYPYCGHLDDPDAPSYDLNFGTTQEFYFRLVMAYLSANLFNVFWSTYMGEITDKDSKLLNGYFYLTSQDISQLDFRKYIFIDGGLWRINKIADYSTNDDETTRCELLKVIDKI